MTPETKTIINSRLGIRPTVLVEIKYSNGPTYWYSANDFPNCQKRIISFNSLDVESEEGSIGSFGSAEIVLSDYDGALKNLFNTTVIEGSICNIYYWFETLPVDDLTLVFSGKIVSPVTWSEQDRTLALKIASRIRDKKVTVKSNEFTEYGITPPPIAFGNVVGIPASNALADVDAVTMTKIQSVRDGNLTVNSPNVTIKNWEGLLAANSGDPTMSISIDGCHFRGTLNEGVFTFTSFNNAIYMSGLGSRTTSSSDFLNPSAIFPNTINPKVVGLEAHIYFVTKCWVAENEYGKYVKVSPNTTGAVLKHYFVNQLATVSSLGQNSIVLSTPMINPFNEGVLADNGQVTFYGKPNLFKSDPMNKPSSWTIGAGSRVSLIKEQDYIANAIESTEVCNVFGETNEGLIPIKDYTIKSLSPSTVITVPVPLTVLSKQYVSDQIYVTLRTPKSNVMDCLEYIITNYTDLEIDNTSFNLLKSSEHTMNYPVGFALFNEPKAFDLIEQICRESLIGINVKGNTAYFFNVNDTDISASLSIDLDSVEYPTIEMETSDILEIVTRYNLDFVESYFPSEEPTELHKENNVDLFTLEEVSESILIYNQKGCVQRYLDYMLNLHSNIWHEISFKCFLRSLGTMPYEKCSLNLPFTSDDYGIVKSKSLDLMEHQSGLRLRLPTSPSGGTHLTFSNTPIDIIESQEGVDIGYAEEKDIVIKTIPGPIMKGKTEDLSVTYEDKIFTVKIKNIYNNQNYDMYLQCEFVDDADYTKPLDWIGTGYPPDIFPGGIYPNKINVLMPLSLQPNYYETHDIGTVSFKKKSKQVRVATDSNPPVAKPEYISGYQDITPVYQLNDIIRIKNINEGSGIEDAQGNLIWWIDTNIDGRVWANRDPWVLPSS